MSIMLRIYITATILLAMMPGGAAAQQVSKASMKTASHWQAIVKEKPFGWYATEEAKRIADNVLLMQHDCGGWQKNDNLEREFTGEDVQEASAERGDIHEVTIDNGATTTELRFLATIYKATGKEEYRSAFQRGIVLLLRMQMANGGWPQFYSKKGYYMHITYNDEAMANVLTLFKKIGDRDTLYAGALPQDMVQRVQESFSRGVECILNTQIMVNGKPTVWCAQHDEVTLKPAKARAYELPSYSGKESVGLVKLLMSIKNPSKEIVAAVDGAVAWLDAHRIEGKRLDSFVNKDGKRDRRLVDDPAAGSLWARFYTLDDERPFVCDRDGVIKYDLQEIGYERRNGYSWYADWAADLFPKYDKWKKKLEKQTKQSE